MLFSEKSRVPIMFEKATFKRTKDGNKLARLRFAVKLEAEVALNSPAEIRAAFEAVNNRETAITTTQLSMQLPKIEINFFTLPEKSAPSQKLLLDLGDFAVIRDESAIGSRSEPHLFFSAQVGLDDRTALRHWIADNVFCQLFATFEEAQLEFAGVRGAVQGLIDSVPEGTKMSIRVKGQEDVIVADKRKPKGKAKSAAANGDPG